MEIAKGRNTRGWKGVLRPYGLIGLLLACALAAQTPPPQTTPATDAKPSDKQGAKPEAKPDKDKKDDATKPDAAQPDAKPDAKKDPGFSTELPKDLNDQPEFIIGPGDSLQINVWKEPEVSSLVNVRGDCRITLNLIKDVEVCSMTPTQISALLTERLSKFIAAPDVTVTLTGLQSRKIYFIGQGLKRQGGMVLNGPMTISQAISDAGGLSEFANGKKVVIQRRDEKGNVKTFIFNYNDYLKGKNPKGNIVLQPGDIIIVR
jgi:polysaccharide export outer membrane protein